MKGCRFPGWFRHRYLIVFLTFIGVLLSYALRSNLSTVIVSMVKQPTETSTTGGSVCPATNSILTSYILNSTNQPVATDGEFDWDSCTAGIIQGSFYVGYVLTQFPGGILAEKYGAKLFVGLGLLVTSISTILTPPFARMGLGWMLTIRCIAGLGEGVMFPSIHALLSKWAPPSERSRMTAISYTGMFAGPVVAIPLSAWMVEIGLFGGWPAAFYVLGAAGVVWFLFWQIFVSDTPSTSIWISKHELNYIKNAVGKIRQKPPVPWKAILTSLPVWCILLVQMGHTWYYFTIMTDLTIYLHTVINLDIKHSGFLSAIPYVCMWIGAGGTGFVADLLINRKWLTATNTRKLLTTVGHWLPAIFLVAVGYAGCSATLTVVLFSLALFTNGISRVGYDVNQLDLTRHFAGIVMGVTNSVGNIPGILAPITAGCMTTQNTIAQWREVFYIAAATVTVPTILYAFCARAERQIWDYVETEEISNNSTSTEDLQNITKSSEIQLE